MAGRGQVRQKRGGDANAQRQNLSSSGVGSSPSVSSATASVVGGGSDSVSRAAYDPAVARQEANDKKFALWKYVTKKPGQPPPKVSGGGNVIWICNFCKNEYKSTYYRVKGHLLGINCGLGACRGVTVNERLRMEREDAIGLGNVAAASSKQKNEDPLPFLRTPSSRFGSGLAMPSPKKRAASTRGPMDKIYQQEKQDEVDLTIAFFFYLNFISFNVARSPMFIEMCRALVEQAPIGYVPPGSEKLRTTLLVKAKKEVDKILVPIKSTWVSSGVSIVSDGWTDAARHPLINFMVSSQNGPVFLKAVDAVGKYKNAAYMGELFIKVIEDVGVDSCVQIITDNAPVCKAAGLIVEAKYPQIFWTPCIVHSLNLALKSIASDVTWIGTVIEDARHIRNFVQNHTNALTIYRDHAASKRVKDTVLDDGWWERVNLSIKIMDPIISLLRFADTDKPILGDIYEGWDSMIESVKTIVMENESPEYGTSAESLWSTIQVILLSRWDKNCTPLHCLAHSLNPKFYSQEWLTAGVGPSPRFPPHMDGEISQGRKLAFRRIYQDKALLYEIEAGFA